MAFHVGQHILCVDDRDSDVLGIRNPAKEWDGTLDGLTKGAVYTVRDAFYDYSFAEDVLRLAEIIRPNDNGTIHEATYAARRFRPLTDTRIAVFRSLLNPSPSKQTEDA